MLGEGGGAAGNGHGVPGDGAGLGGALRWLDARLLAAVERARELWGGEPGGDRFRGLYVSDADVDRLLRGDIGVPDFGENGSLDTAAFGTRFARLTRSFGLEALDRAVLLLAAAPEVDLRYERIYAYLQDDITRKRPTVDLALSLFTASIADRLAALARFLSDAPLFRHSLVELVPDATVTRPPLLAHTLRVDEQILLFLLGFGSLDRRLAAYATITPAENDGADQEGLGALLRQAHTAREPQRLYLQGAPGAGKLAAARAAAGKAGQPLLELSAVTFPFDDEGRLLALAIREAWLRDAVLYLGDVDTLATAGSAAQHERVREAFERFEGTLILAGSAPWVPGTMGLSRVTPIPFTPLAPEHRAQHWGESLARLGCRVEQPVLSELGARYRFTRRQIDDAVQVAVTGARLRVMGASRRARAPAPSSGELALAARRQSGHALATLARRIEPRQSWSDLMLPEPVLQQLRELELRVVHRERVLGSWGFGERVSRGKGVNALFSGPSGTGKTMAAEVIAGELGLDLFRVELAGVVSKYIGETERNLDRIFAAAERTEGIVFFDEADALFGKRSEVHDSHDRYANLEISYLLQRMEEYEGVAILSTNLRGNLDQAFVRRLAFSIHFPFPDEAGRLAIWERVWPEQAPLAEDIDLAALASRFLLSGGNIRNVALAAGFLAAADGGVITMAHLLQAVRREYEKVGKLMSEAELAGTIEG